MVNYKDLKHSENGMPVWTAFYGPVLQVATTKSIWKFRDLADAVIEAIQLPPELVQLRYASKYHDLVAKNRINWAISDLKIAGLLANPERGFYKITELGKKVLVEKKLEDITQSYVHSFPKYVEHQNKKVKEPNDKDIDEIQSLTLKPEQIKNWFDKQKEDLSTEILAKLRKVDPYVLEHMMVKLLSKMGYEGTNGWAFVTSKSNDGGIDGILNQDTLGLQKIYVQVKRYSEGNNVGRQAISQFQGDLNLKGKGVGIFITTSSFTRGAEEAAKSFNIKLIDGDALTKLMIDYKVGVQVKENYELLEIDDDFFEKN